MNRGKILYGESNEHYIKRRIKTFCVMIFFLSCGIVGIIFIILSIYFMITKWGSEEFWIAFFIPFYSIFILFAGYYGFIILKNYIKGRFQDKLIIYETGISFLDSSDKEFIPFEIIQNVQLKRTYLYYPGWTTYKLEIELKDGTCYTLGRQFKKDFKIINKVILANL